MVIASKMSYNLFISQEWIHGVGFVPSSLHQRISIWINDGIMESVEANQGYFMEDVNHVDKRNFDKSLDNIAPCTPTGFAYMPLEKAFYSPRLHPTHKFMWDREIMG